MKLLLKEIAEFVGIRQYKVEISFILWEAWSLIIF